MFNALASVADITPTVNAVAVVAGGAAVADNITPTVNAVAVVAGGAAVACITPLLKCCCCFCRWRCCCRYYSTVKMLLLCLQVALMLQILLHS
jgi:hypothetical protein